MGFVVNLTGFAPAPRFDGMPFASVLVGESNSEQGPFTTIDSIPIDPLDTTTNATLQFDGWYQITWVDAAGNQEVTPPVRGPVAPLPFDPVRAWVGRLLENVPHLQRQAFTGDGATTTFILRSAPVLALPMTVIVNGAPVVSGTGWTFNANAPRELTFAEPPGLGAAIQLQWFNTLWDQYELAYYQRQARLDYFDDRGVVYQAALYALDVVLLGAATALNFGSGQENFDFQSVFTRLETLRTTWQTHLVERQDTGAPIVMVDVYGDNIGAGDFYDDIESVDPLNWSSLRGGP
jgi:hypothetical protein